ncbi:MAG: fumarate reductase/succinate dehydrogenase flavoprotein subunit, partial [Saccharolobus sp.]
MTGRTVVDFLKSKPSAPTLDYEKESEKLIDNAYKFVKSESGVHFGEILEKLRDIMWDNVGIFRHEGGLLNALSEINKLRNMTSNMYVTDKSKVYNTEFFNALEMRNMIDLAIVITKSALERKESRGAHYRTDYPERDDNNW